MTETTDRQDAVPAIGPTPEASTSIEDVVIAIAAEADESAEPEAVVATAVLVAEEELVDLPAQPAAGSPPELGAYLVDEAPLLDGELEEGIANIFATLHSATSDDAADADAAAADHEADEAETDVEDDFAAVDMSTFRLLGELDRLWHRAA